MCHFGPVAPFTATVDSGNGESGKATVWRRRASLRPRGGEVSIDGVLVTRYRCGEYAEGMPGR